MDKENRFKIISEGMRDGVSETCRKYGISRTLYYRWLKRFKSQGIDGLDDKKRTFSPPNKTSSQVEVIILELVKTYPTYGPKALKYLLDELGHDVSESAVFNVLRRKDLSKRASRIKYSKVDEPPQPSKIPRLFQLKSGECWIFWITDYGYYSHLGHIYGYNLFDLKSKIACTRLYNKVSYSNFEDLLTSTALSVARSLNLKINYICLFEDRKILKNAESISRSKLYKTLHNHGFEAKVHFLKDYQDHDQVMDLRSGYVEECMSVLMTLIQSNKSYVDIKMDFQNFVRKYNINFKRKYGQEWYTPVDYHNRLTNTKRILPIWAYTDRKY